MTGWWAYATPLLLVAAVLSACGVSSHGGDGAGAGDAVTSALAARLGVPLRDRAPVRPDAPLPSPLPATPTVGVGTLRGAFDVNDNGAATYSVPLTIAPGRRGVEPRLSLHYSSDRTSEGLAGVGFALGGLSAITRCPKTYERDGQLREVQFDTSDSFCLDGLRLVVVRGDYGDDQSEYRTEPDTFTKVVSFTDPDHGPDGFVAYTKDGRVLRYGFRDTLAGIPTNASTANALGYKVSQWALASSSDRAGNFFAVHYEVETVTNPDGSQYTAEQFPTSIAYTGFDPSAGQGVLPDSPLEAPTRRIDISYVSLGSRSAFAKGMRFASRRRIATIRSLGPDDALVREYRLAYGIGQSQRTRLDSISECVSDGCKPPTRFTWGEHAATFTATQPGPDLPPDPATPLVNADFDNDGLDDVVYAQRGPSVGPLENWDWFTSLNKNQFFQPPRRAARLSSRSPGDGQGGTESPAVQRAFPFDVDQDGRLDVLYENIFAQQEGNRRPARLGFGMIRGDGAGFLGGDQANTPRDYSTDGLVPLETTVLFGDMNGDGVPDRIVCHDNRWTVALHRGADFAPPVVVASLEDAACSLPSAVVDVNGDGAADLLVANAPGQNFLARVTTLLLDGAGKPVIGGSFVIDSGLASFPDETSRLDPSLQSKEPHHRFFVDVNGDGLRDAVTFVPTPLDVNGAGHLFLAMNTGAPSAPFAPPVRADSDIASSLTEQLFGLALVLDANGDGRDDLLLPHLDATHAAPAPTYLLLRGNDDGFAVESTSIPYQFRDDVKPSSLSALLSAQGPRVMELNGDGYPDVLVPTHDHHTREIINGLFDRAGVDLLVSVTDGLNETNDASVLGSSSTTTVQIDYNNLTELDLDLGGTFPGERHSAFYRPDKDASCAYPIKCVVGPKRVVSGYRVDEGATDLGTRSRTRFFAFQYRGARYDRLGGGWLGFAERIGWEGMGAGNAWASRTEVHYDNRTYDSALRTYPFAGKPVQVTRAHGGLRSYADSGTCEVTETASSYATRTTTPADIDSLYRTYFPYEQSQTVRRAATLNSHCTQYYGEGGVGLDVSRVPLLTSTRTDVALDDFGNALTATTTFADGGTHTVTKTFATDASTWLVAEETAATECGQEAGGAPSCRRTAYTKYDANGLLGAATLRQGEVALEMGVTLVRDRYGNVTLTTARAAHTGEHRAVGVTFSDDGIFPVVSADALGYASRRAYDPARGFLLTERGANGLVTQRSYDGFGRLGREVRPDGTETLVTFRRDNVGSPAAPRWRMGVHAKTTGGEETDVLADAHGRPQRIGTFVFDSPDQPAGKEVVRYLAYDPLVEKVVSRSIPTSPAADQATVPGDFLLYDSRGQLLYDTAPDGSKTAYQLFNLITHVVDPSSHQRSTTLDSHGRVSVVGEGAGDSVQTTYHYDGTGAVDAVTDPAGNVTRFTNDILGEPLETSDPDRGKVRQTFNAFGEVTSIVEANGNETRFVYDRLGRPVHREATTDGGRRSERTDFCWDVAPGRGIGRLAGSLAVHGDLHRQQGAATGCDAVGSAAHRGAPDGGVLETYAYDDLGRVVAFGQVLAAGEAGLPAEQRGDLVLRYEYDDAGHVASIAYPLIELPHRERVHPSVSLAYDAHGFLREVRNTTPGTAVDASLLWQAERSDSAGRLSEEQFGGGVTRTTRVYEEKTGRLSELLTATGNEPPASPAGFLQDLRYKYFPDGSLRTRTDLRQSAAPGKRDFTETFSYDDRDRMTSVSLAATGAIAETHYDLLGNITSKSGVGAYAYDDATHPHQVTKITRPDGEVERYAYDPSGDETARPGSRGIDYTSFHLPSRMRTRDADVRFAYDADGARVQKTTDAETIVYVAGLYERIETHDGRRAVEHRVYVPGPGRNIAILKFHGDERETPARETLFVHQDHLGSLDALSNPAGQVVERHSYDAFGAPRDPDWSKTGAPPRGANGSTLGFTAQEDDPELGLVNMRGRLYDPRRGRFLSADPHTPSALSIGWNRYAYANDNPLRFVDPTGFDGIDGNEYDNDQFATPADVSAYGGALQSGTGTTDDGYVFGDLIFPKSPVQTSGTGDSDDAATATASGADASTAQTDAYSRPPSTAVSGNASHTDSGAAPCRALTCHTSDLSRPLGFAGLSSGQFGRLVESLAVGTISIVGPENTANAVTSARAPAINAVTDGQVIVSVAAMASLGVIAKIGGAAVGSLAGAGAAAVEGMEAAATRRLATVGDTQFRTGADALAEALERHGIDLSTVETELMYGKNPSLLGPKGQPWEMVRGLNEEGSIVEFQHHSNGHVFLDHGTFELPHYHGPNGEHLTYEQ